ncbi:MAG TPA: TRAP transporter TatT component family protein [Polyangia bacterium]|jgi:hypothetical protein
MRAALLVLSLAGLAACNPTRYGVDQGARVITAAAPVFYTEPDVTFAREAMAANLKLVEGLLLVSSQNRDLLVRAAEGFCGYAFLFVEDDYEALAPSEEAQRAPLAARASAFYDRAEDYAIRYLEVRRPGVRKALTGPPAELEAVLGQMDTRDVPGLFWLAFAKAGYLNLNRDKVDAIASLGRIEAVLGRVIQLDERFFHGGAHLALGAILSSRPRMLGGDPARGRREIERAIALSDGRFLLSKLLLARHYAVAVGDRALFEQVLREVAAASPALLPEQRLANEIARRRAERYLGLADELF